MIHYIGVTSMAKPHIYVPPQHPSPRKVQKGDVVFCELSAYWWDYPGQVLRTFTVGADATPLYRDLHHAAEAAFDAVTAVVRHGTKMQEIIDAASSVIEAAGLPRSATDPSHARLRWRLPRGRLFSAVGEPSLRQGRLAEASADWP